MRNQTPPSIPAASSSPAVGKVFAEPLNGVKLLPEVGREKAVSQRVSPGFLSLSLICQEPCAVRGRNLVLFLTGLLKTAATFFFLVFFFSLSLSLPVMFELSPVRARALAAPRRRLRHD